MLDATPLLRLYARYRNGILRSQSAPQVQEKVLFKLLKAAANTKFGLEHNFSNISSIAEYQNRVPIRTYEDFWSGYWQSAFPRLNNITWPGKIPYFPVSSGTSSGKTKYIPCSKEMLQSNTKAGLDLLVHHIVNRPNTKLFGGKSFMLGGSTDLIQESPGVFSGDLSGIAAKTMPWWIRPRYFPPENLALIKDWEQKIDRFCHESLHQNIRMISGVPAWLLIYFEKLKAISAKNKVSEIYPNLELLVHGGVNFGPYYEQFRQLLAGSKAELREVYPASEGFIASADRGFGEGLRVVLDHGIFFEFVPVDELKDPKPRRHWIGNIERDVNYAILLTTCAGLWSYLIGDTVKFVDRDPPRLLVTGRTSYYLSAFGEHLIAEEIEDAISNAARQYRLIINDYSVGAVYPSRPDELGGHLYIIECKNQSEAIAVTSALASLIDERLCERNDDYAAHRAKGFGLRAPTIQIVPPGFFADWMKRRGKLGGQNKVPRIIVDKDLFDGLRQDAHC